MYDATYVKTIFSVSKQIVAMVNNLPTGEPRFMLDRDQIFYSRAFRRLAGKTQLFAAGQDELLRTRLTHTLEVSQIARSIAEALSLDLDLVEAMVLGHDLGHTPFGHVGERTLHEIMTPAPDHVLGSRCPLYGDTQTLGKQYSEFLGFKHNLQSLVVAMELEKNASGRGLNLTPYTLYGIQAHTKQAYKENPEKTHKMLGFYTKYLDTGCRINGEFAWSLEAQLVNQADEIAQMHHDLEDALLADVVTKREIVTLLKPMLDHCSRPLSNEEERMLENPDSCDQENFAYMFTRLVVELLMSRLAESANKKILKLGGSETLSVIPCNPHYDRNLKNAHTVRASAEECADIFSFGDKKEKNSLAAAAKALSDYIKEKILKEKAVQAADEKGKETIQELFRAYYEEPARLPDDCIIAFFGAYCSLSGDAEAQVTCRSEFRNMTEEDLRNLAHTQRMDQVRARFTQVFQDRDQATDAEELLLMRTICNHIASMTDAEARRTHDKLCKKP